MSSHPQIPVFTLYGETAAFPDLVHYEPISARSAALNWSIKPHRHAAMAQCFAIDRGGVNARIDDAEFRLKDMQFLFVPPQVVHSFEFLQGTDGHVLSFPVAVLRSVGPTTPHIDEALGGPITGTVTDDMRMLIAALAACLATSDRFRAQRALGLSHALLASVAEVANGASRHVAPRLAAFDELISKHMSEPWTASDYARALAVSAGHLSRLCREATGLGAQAYIERAKMDEACRLLAFTQTPVAQIGYRLGFGDPSYFSRRFQVVCGKSPKDFRAGFAQRPE